VTATLWIGIAVGIVALIAVVIGVVFLLHRRQAKLHTPVQAEEALGVWLDRENVGQELECENPLAESDEWDGNSAASDPDEAQQPA
jgi:flagellar basal body-associated protein FliL